MGNASLRFLKKNNPVPKVFFFFFSLERLPRRERVYMSVVFGFSWFFECHMYSWNLAGLIAEEHN